MHPGDQALARGGAASTFGELPVATLAEEIDTPGADGEHVRALITVAGNPARSTPNQERLEAALEELDLMVCVDAYLNETARHADVVLPVRSPLACSHYDVAFTQLAVRNVANFSPPTVALAQGERAESDTLLALAGIVPAERRRTRWTTSSPPPRRSSSSPTPRRRRRDGTRRSCWPQ